MIDVMVGIDEVRHLPATLDLATPANGIARPVRRIDKHDAVTRDDNGVVRAEMLRLDENVTVDLR